jgi:adenosylmethionine-8-amino-7-oxononanoate aminotransferase
MPRSRANLGEAAEASLTHVERHADVEAGLENLWLHNGGGNPADQVLNSHGSRVFVSGKGVYVTDANGRRYLDAMSGIFVVAVGHGREEIGQAMAEQAVRIAFTSPYGFTNPTTASLAQRIASLAPGDLNHVLFLNSGSEAIEASIKIAKQYHFLRGSPKRTKVISRRRSYHGSTFGAMSVGGERAQRDYFFGPPLAGTVQVTQPYPFNCEFECYPNCSMLCARFVERTIQYEGPDNIAAIVGEPISANGGAALPHSDYWPELRRICDRYGILLIADEVMNGFGRTGKWFGVDHWGIVPDLMAVSKQLASGYAPISAVIARDHVFDTFVGDAKRMFLHVSTFGGNAVACAAALKNLEIIEREDLVNNAREMGAYLLERFRALEKHPTVMDVHGVGLWVAWEMVRNKRTRAKLRTEDKLVERLDRHLLDLGVVLGRIMDPVQIAPPLCIGRDECDELFEAFDDAIGRYERESGLG